MCLPCDHCAAPSVFVDLLTLTFKFDLDIIPFDLHAEFQVCISVHLVERVVNTQTHKVKTIIPDADARCKYKLYELEINIAFSTVNDSHLNNLSTRIWDCCKGQILLSGALIFSEFFNHRN